MTPGSIPDRRESVAGLPRVSRARLWLRSEDERSRPEEGARMKYHWFAEATYNDIPPKDPNGDPNAFLSNARFDSLKIGEHYRMFTRLMQQADSLYWDGIAVNEHHQSAFAMTP